MFVMIAPTSISPNPVQAHFGAAMRDPSSTAEAKYRIAISKKMIQTSRTSRPCAVSAR